MRYGSIPGLDKPVSRLVLGTDAQSTWPRTSRLYDAWIEKGGNAFDTAFHYRHGRPERLLGEWHRSRGVRDRIVIIGKGAHPPNCNPQAMHDQLTVSLERMQTDHVDLYLLHRDNLDVPVGEWVDVLNRNLRAGRIRAFGGSNWSRERLIEANAYAARHGLAGFVALSNNLSLARMAQPIWPGTVSAWDPAFRAWLTETQTALLPWSAQARGFFTRRAAPDKLKDAELVRWYSDDNFERRRRAFELARKKGVRAINVALAWVLNQPFPSFPLIGSRNVKELESSLATLRVELTPDEFRWLSLEEESNLHGGFTAPSHAAAI